MQNLSVEMHKTKNDCAKSQEQQSGMVARSDCASVRMASLQYKRSNWLQTLARLVLLY